MDVKEAVKTAKDWVTTLLAEEGVSNVGLEEVKFDEATQSWLITIGFTRPWNSSKNALAIVSGKPDQGRSYRVIRVSDGDGKVESMLRSDAGE